MSNASYQQAFDQTFEHTSGAKEYRPERISQLSENLAGKLSKEGSSRLDKIAKKSILQALEAIEYGYLEIQDGDELYCFGRQDQEPRARVKVNSPKAYREFAFGGNVGGAEAYILSYWDTPDLLQVTRLLGKNISVLSQIDSKQSFIKRMALSVFHRLNLNSKEGSKRNIGAHYDLGNGFFESFLDQSMMYSSAIFKDEHESLFEASEYKLDLICKKLNLQPSDHLVEIGTGWGGMAVYAASHYGCKVTTTTISEEQYDYAHNKVIELGLEDRVTVLKKDYRELSGRYDKLVSIEMIEAVGKEHYSTYFEKCSSLLKEDGLMLIQAITIPDQRYKASLKSVDFIQKYIFPGGRLPSNQVISNNLSEHTDLQIADQHDIGLDYAKTIWHWRHNFYQKKDEIKAQGYNEIFCRMWDYYLCYCEGGFQERAISTVQYLMAKPQASLASFRS